MSRNKKEPYESHHLLDQDCRHYMESAVYNYHQISEEIFSHIDFLSFWFNEIEKEPTAQNAMLCTFRFFNRDYSKLISFKKRNDGFKYIEKLKKHYSKPCNSENTTKFEEGTRIFQWIKDFLSEKNSTYIKIKDIDWLPAVGHWNWAKSTWSEKEIKYQWSAEEITISKEMSFGWSISRLWQLLEERKKTRYIENFLGLRQVNDTNSVSEIKKTSKKELSKFKTTLTNTEPEPIKFFEKNLNFFSPEYLSFDELSNFWIKACVSSTKDKSATHAIRQPLDKIWLLARFFGVHFYNLDFIESKRGIPSLVVMHFEALNNPALLQDLFQKKTDDFHKKNSIILGEKCYATKDFLSSEKGKNILDALEKLPKQMLKDLNLDIKKFIEIVFFDWMENGFNNINEICDNLGNDLDLNEKYYQAFWEQKENSTGLKKILNASFNSYLSMHKSNLFLLASKDIPYNENIQSIINNAFGLWNVKKLLNTDPQISKKFFKRLEDRAIFTPTDYSSSEATSTLLSFGNYICSCGPNKTKQNVAQTKPNKRSSHEQQKKQ